MNKARWIGIGIVTGIVLAGGYAAADQCTNLSVTKSQWDWARRHTQAAPSVLSFCAPCGDKAPQPWSGHLDKDADLAYLYVQVGDDNFANLARLVSCPVSGVPAFIDRSGKPH